MSPICTYTHVTAEHSSQELALAQPSLSVSLNITSVITCIIIQCAVVSRFLLLQSAGFCWCCPPPHPPIPYLCCLHFLPSIFLYLEVTVTNESLETYCCRRKRKNGFHRHTLKRCIAMPASCLGGSC